VAVDAKPAPVSIDTSKAAVIVVDMQNGFGSEGSMSHRAGIVNGRLFDRKAPDTLPAQADAAAKRK
jgi:nicotinamidase-related amidase